MQAQSHHRTPAAPHRARTRRGAFLAASATAVLALALAGCGSAASFSGHHHTHTDGAAHGTADPSAAAPSAGGHAGHDMAGHDAAGAGRAAAGNGLAAERGGYRLTATAGTAGTADTLPAGTPAEYRFTITGPDGKPVTAFAVDQTKRMHFYAIRTDLTGFQHLHPEMATDGTWTAPLAALAPGSWRLYASFTPDSGPGAGGGLVLSRTVTVAGEGAAASEVVPAATGTATVDGYTVAVEGALKAGSAGALKVTVSRDGAPVTDLQPYLDTYAHLTAFHAGDQAFAHLHPQGATTGGDGGPTLPFHAELPAAGDWRLFLQFQTGGTLHTAALTLRVA
ncbi:hypothetical protein [Kitasatospora sp. NPDC050543]|uniref:hypothetical protein n=1 Tax=Kitasatospora sp. NPDC050543 TaxID=3364054 RepID=UPI0037BD80DE